MAKTFTTSFQSHHGKFLNAAFGGGAEGETINGLPVGLLSAHADTAETDETFTVEVLDDTHIALRSVNGQYVCAEGGGGGELIANRAYETPGPWETFQYELVDRDAFIVALRSHNGAYVTAEQDGTIGGRAYESPGPWECWTSAVAWWIEDEEGGGDTDAGGGDVTSGNRVPKGAVWLDRRVLTDENGPFLGLCFSFFWVARAFRDYRDRYDANLAWGQQHGFNAFRGFVTVGGWPGNDAWINAGADKSWALDLLPQWLDDAFARYHLRCSLTLFDGEVQFPTDGEQDAYVHQVCDILLQRMHTIQDVQVANEYGPTGWDYEKGVERLRRHAQTLRRRLGSKVPIGISARNTGMTDGGAEEVYAECHKLYDGLLPEIVTTSVNHDSREIHKACGPWRPVRQGWERVVSDPNTGAQLEPDCSIDDEPIGPSSSVAQEEDPTRIVQKAIVDWISGRHEYTYHPDAGIWSDLLNPAYVDGIKGCHRLVADHAASANVGRSFATLVPLLSPYLTVWHRTRHGFNDHPFRASFKEGTGPHGETGFSQIWPDGITPYGVVRAYAAYDGNDFVCGLTGVKDHITLTWTDKMRFDLYRCKDGSLALHVDAAEGGGSLTVDDHTDTDFLIVGKYV